MSPTGTHDTLADWRESAPYWAKHAEVIGVMFASITAGLIEEAEIAEGQLVLDVAGGVGDPALAIARQVGDKGRVTFTDAVPEMVSAAESRARLRGISNLDFHVCCADSLPFDDNSFDAAVCRFGVMLFPDPGAAIGEMLRVLRPGASLALAVWSHREANPFFHIVADIVSRYVESQPEEPDAPGAFRFAKSELLASAVRDAGASEVRQRVLRFDLAVPLTPEQYWPFRVELSETLRSKVARLSQSELSRVAGEVVDAGRKYYREDKLIFPAEVLLVKAKKPRANDGGR